MANTTSTGGKGSTGIGTANELRTLAELLDRGYTASVVEPRDSKFDILAIVPEGNGTAEAPLYIRAQIKTTSIDKRSGSLSIEFSGGKRAGKDRKTIPGVKVYRQSVDTSDVVIGVHCQPGKEEGYVWDYYFVPTLAIDRIAQDSIAVNRLPAVAKNNWDLFKKCRDKKFVDSIFGDLYKGDSGP